MNSIENNMTTETTKHYTFLGLTDNDSNYTDYLMSSEVVVVDTDIDQGSDESELEYYSRRAGMLEKLLDKVANYAVGAEVIIISNAEIIIDTARSLYPNPDLVTGANSEHVQDLLMVA